MKTESLLFTVLTVYFLLITPIYYLLSHEKAGSIALLLTFFLSLIITSYTFATGRHMAPRPEDRLDGEISDATGEIGFFSPHSVWPLYAGIAAAIVVLGVCIGWWLVAVGMAFLLAAVVGMTFEYYKEDPRATPGGP